MSIFSKRFFLILFFAVALCAVIPFHAVSQSLKAGSSLRVIYTDFFDIIFPEKSRTSAEFLASFADKTLVQVTTLLNISYTERIPVTISPDTDRFNGYMNPFPYPHIVLYDAPPDVEYTTYRNSLESLFLHELTHVVSLHSRDPFLSFMHKIFGAWVSPTGLSAPMFMVEGVTVSFESLEGFGRSNDPLVTHELAQAYSEGKFLTPFQAAGVYDHPPFGNAYYEYGGLFSSWLQEKYGMEQYATLWHELGKLPPLSLFFYTHGFFARFTRVYGISFLDAWEQFSASLCLKEIKPNTAGVLTSKNLSVLSVAAGKSSVYFLDQYSRNIIEINPTTGLQGSAAKVDSFSNSIAISSDESLMLVSGYRMSNQLAAAEVREYSLETGSKTGRIWKGVTKAAYFRDGIIGLSSEGHANSLVYCGPEGKEDALLVGNPERLFSAPVPIGEDHIAFIVSIKGSRKIGIYEYNTRNVFLFEIDRNLDETVFRYARGLSSSSGSLFFSYHDGHGVYKLACIRSAATNPQLICCDTDYSGGVFSPVLMDYKIIYKGQFSSGDALLKYPERVNELSGSQFSVKKVLWNEPLPELAVSLQVDNTRIFPEKNYFPLSWLNPLHTWFPFPLVQTSGNNIRLGGGGFATYLATPTDMNACLLFSAYDARERMAFVDATWVSFVPGDPLVVHFTDGVHYSNTGLFDSPRRETRVTVSLNHTRGIGGERIHYSFIPSFESAWIALPCFGAVSAYEWDYLDGAFIPGLSLGVQNWHRLPWELFGKGLSVTLSARACLPDKDFRYDVTIRAAAGNMFPFRVTAYGVYDETGLYLDASSLVFEQGSYASASSVEYAKDSLGGHLWVAGGEVEFQLFSIEVQKNLSHLYCNRFFGILAWRPVFFDGDQMNNSLPGFNLGPKAGFAHSAILKTGAVVSLIPIAAIPLRFSPHLWGGWKFSNTNSSIQKNLVFGISLAVEW